MTDIEKISLSAADIAAILGACAASGAATLKFGPLEVTFHPPTGWERISQTVPDAFPAGNEIPDAETQTQLELEALENAELQLRQSQLEELPITDPLEYEHMVARGELTDESGTA